MASAPFSFARETLSKWLVTQACSVEVCVRNGSTPESDQSTRHTGKKALWRHSALCDSPVLSVQKWSLCRLWTAGVLTVAWKRALGRRGSPPSWWGPAHTHKHTHTCTT